MKKDMPDIAGKAIYAGAKIIADEGQEKSECA